MPAPLLYLLQANVALLLLAALYLAVLRPLTFYGLNRVYLVFTLLFAALYPLVDVAGFWAPAAGSPALAPAVASWQSVVSTWQPPAPVLDYSRGLLLAYWAGVVWQLGRLGLQLLALHSLYRRSHPALVHGQPVRALAEPISAFSFWQTIFLNPSQYPAAELPVVLRHELVHVRQWHTLDTLLAQLVTVVFWLNPGAWLLRRAVAENLEFITDQALLDAGIDLQAYQYSLLRATKLASGSVLGNQFQFLTLKTRIAMMNKKASSPAHLAKYLLLAPLALGLSLTFAGAQSAPQGGAARLQAQAPTPDQPEATVYYLNGQLSSKAIIDQLNPNDIAAMNVLKGASVGQALASTAATQAVLITTKHHEDDAAVVGLNRKLNSLVDLRGKLLLIGEQPVSLTEFQQALTTQTRQVTALSPLDAQKRFGDQAKNGAVLIPARH